MKKIIATALLALPLSLIACHEAKAEAEESPKLYVPNDIGGHVFLTIEPCDIAIPEPLAKDRQLRRAYATQNEGTPQQVVYEGCWSIGIPPDSEAAMGAIPVVNIFTPDGAVYSQPFGDFRPYRVEDNSVHI